MSLAVEIFPTISGGENFLTKAAPEVTEIVRVAADAAAKPIEKVSESLNRRDPHTGEPKGALAIMKDRMLMRVLRRRKMSVGPYRRLRLGLA